jgi:glutaredoxin
MQEDSIDMLIPRSCQYKEKLAKYQGKDPGYIQILKKEDEEREEIIKNMVNAETPSYPYIDNIPYVNFSEVILAHMWDKRKG